MPHTFLCGFLSFTPAIAFVCLSLLQFARIWIPSPLRFTVGPLISHKLSSPFPFLRPFPLLPLGLLVTVSLPCLYDLISPAIVLKKAELHGAPWGTIQSSGKEKRRGKVLA